MALTPISIILRRSLSSRNLHPSFFAYLLKPFSTASQPNPCLTNSSESQHSNLSARLSFVFDQIDAIERERSQKDETLQQIRAWRESKTQTKPTHEGEFELSKVRNNVSSGFGVAALDESKKCDDDGEVVKKEVELVHPWPEWIELMERLVHQNYFDHKRRDEDKMVEDLGFDMSEVVEEGFDFTRDWKTVQTACLNFGKDRFDILRSLSKQDIQILVGYGCPSADKKVVFSAKLLRKHVHLDEGDVCSSCSLRSSCERAYLLTNKEDEARTIDIMRVLLTYGFDPINGSVVNKSLLKQKSVKTVARKLLHLVVKLSSVPIDPNLPPPVFKKPPPKVKQLPPPPRKRVGRDDIEMKKGDWLCSKCDFMNFAKNTVCLQCDAKRPKRQLLPGEWECPECNFLNYRRNTACFHCECRRPHDEYTENQMQERQQHGLNRTRLEKVPSKAEISNSWNFDFDDNESDGADVAAFEHADTPRMREEDFPVDVRSQVGHIAGYDSNFNEPGPTRIPINREDGNKPNTGFDDFDDEEDDDIESYEIDPRNELVRKPFIEELSESEEDINDRGSNRPLRRAPSSSRPTNRRSAFSGSEDDGPDFDSDKDLSIHPNWKSSHVANSRQSRGRGGSNGSSRNLSFGSDEDHGLDSDSDDDFKSRKSLKGKLGSNKRDFNSRRGVSDSDDGSYGSDSSDDDDQRSFSNRSRGNNKTGPTRGGNNNNKGHKDYNFTDESEFRSNGKMSDRRNSFTDNNFDKSSRGSRGSRGRGSKGGDYGGQKRNEYRGNTSRDFDGPESKRGGYRDQERGQRRGERGDNVHSFDRPKRGGFGDRPKRGGFGDRPKKGGFGDQPRGDRRSERGGKPRQDEGFGNKRRGGSGRFRENDGDQNFGDERPRRVRIIER